MFPIKEHIDAMLCLLIIAVASTPVWLTLVFAALRMLGVIDWHLSWVMFPLIAGFLLAFLALFAKSQYPS